ncbi:MAG: dihydrofolate reductase family protein [Verrucomicrobiota bacterium]|nr:dihydrofolate reductase family protein [Limisphaera sp.]MDW8382168.1 dihydrofolate reductase family protein [Verrucomicrobiota bacterium]
MSLSRWPRPQQPIPRSRPLVIVNMAMTADGKIATADQRIATFGSRLDHEYLLALRATADAVVAGARTIQSGAVDLGPGPRRFRQWRMQQGLAEYNLRIVVTGSGSLTPQAHLFRKRFSPILVLTTERAPTWRLKKLRSVADAVWVCGRMEIDWLPTLQRLRQEWRVQRLVCEGGGQLNDSLIRAGLVDELFLTVCPYIVGGRAAPTIAEGEGFDQLEKAKQFRRVAQRRRGNELFLHFVRADEDAPI